ncbi:ABC transporter permease [Brevibacillus nitrificans]|uniref:ABC transporter permease n=1 Tax=Brevibacillus nitrificans TaxID=651560 RepID=UPI00260DE5FB|nr:ABC transporter permease [Brevibacillus nitrificans]MED1795139.1 ABC transporter permease [Brevibacillus nitrificans]
MENTTLVKENVPGSLPLSIQQPRTSPLREFIKHFRRNRLGVIGLFGILALLLLAVFAPAISDRPTGYGDVTNMLQPPSSLYWFGTDSVGLSIFDQVVWGTRVSLYVGLTSAVISILIGVPIGLLSGYYGGRVSHIGMAITDIFLTLPVLPLMIIMAAVLGTGISNIAIIIGLFSWPQIARVTRAETLAIREKQYIEAARAIGTKESKIIFRHVLLNAFPPILVNMTIIMGTSVLSEAGLSFLGLGDPMSWSWGTILQNAHSTGVIIHAWWLALFPSIAIVVLVLSFNFLGIGINEALNPRLRKR